MFCYLKSAITVRSQAVPMVYRKVLSFEDRDLAQSVEPLPDSLTTLPNREFDSILTNRKRKQGVRSLNAEGCR